MNESFTVTDSETPVSQLLVPITSILCPPQQVKHGRVLYNIEDSVIMG